MRGGVAWMILSGVQLPADIGARDRVLLSVMGSPDTPNRRTLVAPIR
jgi:2-methylaconitate cis-trans-isomerase PrpF